MIVTEIYTGQGLGNQLACYITTRVIALDKGYDFGIMNPQNFKGLDFFDLDFGKKVTGGKGPAGGPPTELPEGITQYYNEKKVIHPISGADIRLYDEQLINIQDNTKIDGMMQDEQYILHRKDEIRKWLAVKKEYECYDYSDENTCVINFRGGEYTRHKDFFLNEKYWKDAVAHMLTINKNFRFIVITDDVFTARKFFPNYGVHHFSIAKDYTIIKNAKYLILSNSSFAWFPAWLSVDLKYCIAPKYWARHNISDGYWSMGYNITRGWHYLDRNGVLSDYDTCLLELNDYIKEHNTMYTNNQKNMISQKQLNQSLTERLKEKTPKGIKRVLKSAIILKNNAVNYVRQPIDILRDKKREKKWLSKIEVENYRKQIKIYDIFNFFNELEVLDIRLNILNDYVDYFVLVESRLTHSGKPKELFYEKNKHLFKKFEHKIIHRIVENPPKDFEDIKIRLADPATTEAERNILKTLPSLDAVKSIDIDRLRESYEKEFAKNVLVDLNLSDNDFCFISDLDEIWNPEAFIDFSKDGVYKLKQDAYIYYLNNRSNEDWRGWTGTIGTKYKNVKTFPSNHLRTLKPSEYIFIRNGGWHFSYQGDAQRIKAKLDAICRGELSNDNVSTEVEDKLLHNKDIKGRYVRFWKDESKLPKYLLENKEKYKAFFR